jgi:DNA repair exonuclease SbcCD ATPase subunit
MKITSLKLENFRCFTALDVTLSNRISVLRGPNHVGKSTWEQAIQYALTARSEGTNAAGAGADETLIRNGADIARVTLGLEVDGEQKKLRATLSRKSGRAIATKDADGVDTTHIMNPWLRDQAEVISCLTNSRYFVDLDPAKQKDILSGIVLPAKWDGWDKEIIAASEKVGLESAAFFANEHPFHVISWSYDAAFEARKNVNRDLKNFIVPNADVADAGDTLEIKAKLVQRREQLTEAQNKRAKMVAGIVSPEVHATRKAAVQARIDKAETKLADENRSLTEHQGKILDRKQLKANKDAAAQKSHAAELDTKIATLEIEIKTGAAAIAKVDSLEDKCHTCEQAITEETKAIIIRPLFEYQEKAKAVLKKTKEDRAAVGDFTFAAQALLDHAAAEKEVTRTTERLQEASQDLKAGYMDLEAIGEATVVDTTDVDAEIAGLQERITKGTEVLTRTTAANERKIAYDAAVVKLAALKEKSALLEKLVAYFGPSGVQATLLQEYVGAFKESMNKVLESWGYRCLLTFDPKFFFGIVTEGPTGAIVWDLKTLSKSERYRFAIAFQVALAMHTGFRFVVIDETDMLDKEGKGGLMQQIIDSDLDQAILVGTDERDTISPGMAAAADFFMVSSSLVDGIPTSSVARLQAAI